MENIGERIMYADLAVSRALSQVEKATNPKKCRLLTAMRFIKVAVDNLEYVERVAPTEFISCRKRLLASIEKFNKKISEPAFAEVAAAYKDLV